MQTKPKVAVHKFSSCDGCQLAFLNLGEALLEVAELVEFVHFAEAGPVDPEAKVDIAFVEGSISTPEEQERIERVRTNSRFLVTIGACATSGGIQALRNLHNAGQWVAGIYATPEYVSTLDRVTPVRGMVKVDLELWGCPVSGRQVLAALRALLSGVVPREEEDKVCMECKRRQAVCVMVTRNVPCMGPVTRTGCGAICPAFGRDCYACYGPSELPNTTALAHRFEGFGLVRDEVAARFLLINNAAPDFLEAGLRAKERRHG
ncbi:MAG TPA: sulfhydrogenase subunit delta [Burkholderiales bacterium]|nr:sulfhydrogenase subunit delta [Burkholderiales bacterium]